MPNEVITNVVQPRIYVACLASYNSGTLHGAWIDAARDPWHIWAGISAMLTTSPVAGAEEWAIHDYEGFGKLHLHEHEGVERISALVELLDEHGALGSAVLEYFSGDVEGAREALADNYLGCHRCLADYLQELLEETSAVPQPLCLYIDWQAMARDAEMSGDLFTIESAHGQTHVFAGR